MSNPSNPNPAGLWLSDLSPAYFFRERLLEAQKRQGVTLTENVEFYLVNMLCEFVRRDGNTQEGDDCLALILKRALESPRGEQVLLLKRLGDTALYFSGFFQEYFNRKCFDVGYYVSMGENAYGNLSSLMRGKGSGEGAMSTIYSEMRQSFGLAVDLLMDVSEQTQKGTSARSTLSIYDAWLSTASGKLERELRDRGIMPVQVKRSAVQ